MGIFNTGVPLGSIICFGLFGRMGSLWGWRVPILLTGIYSLITAFLFLSFYQLPSSQTLENEKQRGLYQIIKRDGIAHLVGGGFLALVQCRLHLLCHLRTQFFLQKGYTIEQSGFLSEFPSSVLFFSVLS